MNKAAHAILDPKYSMVAVAPRIVEFNLNQSLLVETGTIVIATIEKLAPGLDLLFVSWTNGLNPPNVYHGICSVAPRKGAAEINLKVGERLLLQVIQPARFGKLSVLSTDICLITSHLVIWPGIHVKYSHISVSEPPTIVQGGPKLRGCIHGTTRPGVSATGPIRWSRQQYQMETEWERISFEFVQIKINVCNQNFQKKIVASECLSWFCRPVCPSIIVTNRTIREDVARLLISSHPKVPRNFDIADDHAWESWYGLHSAAVNQPQIRLPSGGTLILEGTQSGWCIDVNSGTSLAKESKGRANQEAVSGLIHQISLRSIHGSLMVDFIKEPNSGWLEQILHRCCYLIRNDPYHTRILYVSYDGFMRIVRNRYRRSL